MAKLMNKWHGTGDTEPQTKQLHRVKYTEEITETAERITIRLVWPAGEEKTITYSTRHYHQPHHTDQREYYLDDDGNQVIEIGERPAYSETLEKEEYEYSYTKHRSSWMEEPIPDCMEKTGRTKIAEVIE